MNKLNQKADDKVVLVPMEDANGPTGQSPIDYKSTVSVEPMATNYTALSVFTFLCCCLPMGLCALFYARDAQTLWLHGHPQEAKKRSRISRNINIAGIVIGSLITIALVTLMIVSIVLQTQSYNNRYNYDQAHSFNQEYYH